MFVIIMFGCNAAASPPRRHVSDAELDIAFDIIMLISGINKSRFLTEGEWCEFILNWVRSHDAEMCGLCHECIPPCRAEMRGYVFIITRQFTLVPEYV